MPLLFSYGTLQQEAVQLSTFGRLLQGRPDELVGFEQSLLTIEDPEFVSASGKSDHAIVKFNGRPESRVSGTVFEVTEGELASADQYEPAGYQRVSAMLASGQQAWVYADARFASGPPGAHAREGIVTNQGAGLMILVAGPYRSGTGDDPDRMAANVRAMEAYALPLFRAGHIPLVGEWLALPLVALAGSRRVGDAAFEEIFHPIAERLLARCDAVLRVGGPSAGADLMVRAGTERGLKVFHRLREVPGCESASEPRIE